MVNAAFSAATREDAAPEGAVPRPPLIPWPDPSRVTGRLGAPQPAASSRLEVVTISMLLPSGSWI